MQWKDEYSVGVAEIDEQHKGVIELFTVIDTAIDNREGWSDVFFKLEQLREHARFHFALEESLMRMHDYPKQAEHVDQVLLELHVGRDLQFVRINGTIVGGLVGVVIHTVAVLAN